MLKYCEARKARLIIIPIRYRNPNAFHPGRYEDVWDPELEKYYVQNTIQLSSHVQILGDLKIVATARNPLSGLEALTMGKTTIVGHNQLEMRSCSRLKADHPVILISTGTVSEENYSDTKDGFKARGTHNNSAIVVEIDRANDLFHFRHVEADKHGSFYDIDGYWTRHGKSNHPVIVEALITGDEHAIMTDVDNMKAVYTGPGSIAKTLIPKRVYRHDILDSYAISHHHKDKFFLNVMKRDGGWDNLEDELRMTKEYIEHTSTFLGEGAVNYIVGANHNDHLLKWLECPRASLSVTNARIYTQLRSLMLQDSEPKQIPFNVPDPFKLWFNSTPTKSSVEFISRNESHKVRGIELAMHGDVGPNGSRGSLVSLSKTGTPCVIGHSHSPGIEKQCYQVGTSTPMRLEYNHGLTSWMNTHCVIYPNGKRQLLNVIKGKWRLES